MTDDKRDVYIDDRDGSEWVGASDLEVGLMFAGVVFGACLVGFVIALAFGWVT